MLTVSRQPVPVQCVYRTSRYSRTVQTPTATATARRALSSFTPKRKKKRDSKTGNAGGWYGMETPAACRSTLCRTRWDEPAGRSSPDRAQRRHSSRAGRHRIHRSRMAHASQRPQPEQNCQKIGRPDSQARDKAGSDLSPPGTESVRTIPVAINPPPRDREMPAGSSLQLGRSRLPVSSRHWSSAYAMASAWCVLSCANRPWRPNVTSPIDTTSTTGQGDRNTPA